MSASDVAVLASPEEAFLVNAARIPKPVKVGEDLLDDEGAVIAAKGAVLDEALARRVYGAQLHAKLQLRLPSRLDRHHLRELMLMLPELYPDVGAVAEAFPVREVVSKAINRFNMNQDLIDLLTLFHHRLPGRFERTLLGTWLAAVLVHQLDLPRREQDAVFQGALLRDVGYLYVSPHIIDARHPSDLNRAERAQLRTHPRLSAAVAESAEGVSDEATLAIRWHHARIDGSGFPPKPKDVEIPFYAQLVGFVDAVADARIDGAGDGANLARTRKLLLLNLEHFDTGILSAYMHLVAHLHLDEAVPEEEARGNLVEAMLARAQEMEEAFDALEEEVESGALERRLPKGSPLERLAKRLVKLMRQSGHGSAELVWWLKAVKAGRDDIDWSELLDIDLQQRELQKEIVRLNQAVEEVAPWTRKDILGPELI